MQGLILTPHEYEGVLARLAALEQLTKGNVRQTFLEDAQLQALLGTSSNNTKNWRRQGLLPYSQLGNKRYSSIADVMAMMLFLRQTMNPYVAPHKECVVS